MNKVTWVVDEYMFETRSQLGDLPQAILDAGHDLYRAKYIPLSEDQDYPNLNTISTPVILYGTIGYISRCKIPFFPGTYAFGSETNCNVYTTSPFGDYLLNRDFILLPFGVLRQRISFLRDLFGDAIFIRPNTGKKAFAGTAFHLDDADVELRTIEELQHTTAEEICLIAKAQDLKAEYRFVVGNHEVIDYSQYRRDNVLDIRRDASVEAMNFAEMIAGLKYQPDLIYTLDIAELPSGECRIIEINSFNSSGLYACDKNVIARRVSEIVLADFNGDI